MSNQPWNPLELLNPIWQQAGDTLESRGRDLQPKIEAWAEAFGQVVIPIADFPLIKPLAKIPGLSWIASALGQVNLGAIDQQIKALQTQHPTATTETLVQQSIQAAALKAGGIGLATNFLPPLAITLFAVDMAAIATLQVELIYQIAALYDYDIQTPTLRGEVLALYVCSAGGSTALKSGLSFPEIIPVIGAIIGTSSDAAILWSIGQAANHYYKTKRNRT